jgi:hypothetical protein
VLLSAWLIGIFLLSITGYKTALSFKGSKTNSKQIALIQPTNGSLLVQLTDSTGRKINKDDEEDIESFNINDEGVIVNGINLKDMERIPVAKPDLEIMPSMNDSFYLQQIVTARGRNTTDAGKNADATIYTFNQTNDTLLNLNREIPRTKHENSRCYTRREEDKLCR